MDRRLICLALFAVASIASVASCQDVVVERYSCEQVDSYSEAYERSQRQGRPLLVLLSSDGCAPCQAVKKNVLAPLLLDPECEAVIVEVPIDSDIGEKIRSSETRLVPQIAVFLQVAGKPVKRLAKSSACTLKRVREMLLR